MPSSKRPAAQQVERRRGLGEDSRRPQRQVANVGEDPHRRRLGEDGRQQRLRVEVARLVGMVLDAQQVVAEPVDQARGLEDALRVGGVRDEEVAEFERMAVLRALVDLLR